MKVTYGLIQADYRAFYNHYILKADNPFIKYLKYIRRFLQLIVFAGIFTIILYKYVHLNYAISIVIGIALGIVGFYLIENSHVTKMMNTHSRNAGPETLEIQKNGLLLTREHDQHEIPWSSVIEVAYDKICLYIYTDLNSALIVPLRCFESSEASEQFIQELNRRAEPPKKK